MGATALEICALQLSNRYCSHMTCVALLRPTRSPFQASLKSCFSILISFFSFCRSSAHYFLHDLSIFPTNFLRGALAIFFPLQCFFFTCCHLLLLNDLAISRSLIILRQSQSLSNYSSTLTVIPLMRHIWRNRFSALGLFFRRDCK